jgi:hypothetical protein
MFTNRSSLCFVFKYCAILISFALKVASICSRPLPSHFFLRLLLLLFLLLLLNLIHPSFFTHPVVPTSVFNKCTIYNNFIIEKLIFSFVQISV